MRIASDGYPFILPPIFAAALAAAAGLPLLAAATGALGLAIAAFFRDPDRHGTPPPGGILSPADGRVVEIERDDDGVLRLAIFLSLFDVHIARAPVAGTVTRCDRIPGGFAAAYRAVASDNARVVIDIESDRGTVGLALMAGAVARRVLPWTSVARTLRQGERIAIIRFGSRAELVLPSGFEPLVQIGARVRAGQTPVAVK